MLYLRGKSQILFVTKTYGYFLKISEDYKMVILVQNAERIILIR